MWSRRRSFGLEMDSRLANRGLGLGFRTHGLGLSLGLAVLVSTLLSQLSVLIYLVSQSLRIG